MTTIGNDYLTHIFNGETNNHRHTLWLWFHLVSYGADLPLVEVSNQGLRDRIAQFISERPGIIENIKLKKNEELVPENYLNWINEGERQYEWMLKRIKHQIGALNYIPPARLDRRTSLIMTFDLWEVGITEKILILNELKIDWTAHKSKDNTFKWFKENDKKCLLAGSYLEKNTQFFHPHPIDNYEELMIFFDNARMNPHEIIFHIEKIKRKWSQQKYRQGLTGKAQYNFILSDEAIIHLDKVANAHGLSRAQILELLIRIESERNLCSPEITKRKQFVDSL